MNSYTVEIDDDYEVDFCCESDEEAIFFTGSKLYNEETKLVLYRNGLTPHHAEIIWQTHSSH